MGLIQNYHSKQIIVRICETINGIRIISVKNVTSDSFRNMILDFYFNKKDLFSHSKIVQEKLEIKSEKSF